MNGIAQGPSAHATGTDTNGVPSSSSDGDGTKNVPPPMHQQQPGFPPGYQQTGPGGSLVPPALVQTASGGNGQLLNGNGVPPLGSMGSTGSTNIQMYPVNGGQMMPQMMPNGQPQGGGQINPQQQQQYQQMQQQQMYQQQMMQQQQYNAAGSSSQGSHIGGSKPQRKAWHTAEDQSTRASMIERIVGLLQQRRPNATPDWQEKLPHMAKRLENELYMQAETLAEYSDPLTLKNRLQQLALSMGNKQAAKQPGAPNGVGVPGASGSTGQGQGPNGGTGNGSGMYNMQQQWQMTQHLHHQQQLQQNQQMQQQQQQQQQQQSSNQTGSHMRTAQAAASQYPMGYYGGGAMDNGQGLAQGQPMVGGDMQHFNMQQASAAAVTAAQRQMINVAQLNPMLAGDVNGSSGQSVLPGGQPMDPNSANALARGQLTARLGGVPMQSQAVLSQPPGGFIPIPNGMLANQQQQQPMMMNGGMSMQQQMGPGGQYPGNKTTTPITVWIIVTYHH